VEIVYPGATMLSIVTLRYMIVLLSYNYSYLYLQFSLLQLQNGILQNPANDRHCPDYQFTVVPGTNVFFGVTYGPDCDPFLCLCRPSPVSE